MIHAEGCLLIHAGRFGLVQTISRKEDVAEQDTALAEVVE
jgi:hypothetical protein